MAIMPDRVWSRHANPWSGWSRVLLMPLLAVGMYQHSWPILLGAVLFAIVNPFMFPRPRHTRAWMSRGVIGEQLYYADGKKFKWDLPTLLNSINIPCFFAFLYFGWTQQLIPMLLAGALTMTIKFWFIDRMVRVADSAHGAHA